MRRNFLFLSAVIGLLFSSRMEARNIYVLSAGVSDYPGTANDLNLPANDAKAICRLYRTNSGAKVVLLTNSNATKAHILDEARRLFKQAAEDDIVVFFFSGHGYNGGFAAYDEGISYDEVRKLFSVCKARNKMIFADACFSGDIRENGRSGGPRRDNVLLFLSSRSNETSIESPSMKNGYFAACLIRALKGGADLNHDRMITAKELFSAVSSGVKSLSNDRQHPVMWGNFDGNMPVMVW